MPWLRVGDNAATNPLVMALALVSKSDERTQNEVFGFVVRLATQSSAHMTDYRVDLGTAQLFGGSRTPLLLKQAVAAGLLVEHGRGASRSWALVDDVEFLHMPSKAEVLWKRQRQKDSKNESLTVPVRLRDGDECRYCSRIVNWNDRRGAGGGTYDHLEPGEIATVPTFVVCCSACNKSLSDLPTNERLELLRQPPAAPFYSTHSARWLTDRGHPTEPTPAQSESARAEAPAPGSSPEPAVANPARPRSRNTAAHARPTATAAGTAAPARDEPTSPSTAATVRDSAPGTPQPSARATPWVATAANPARPDFLSDPAANPARPDFLSDTAATSEARPAPHPADTAPAQRMEDPTPEPPDTGPGSVGNLQNRPRSDVSMPGRDGTGQVGSGAAGPWPGAVPSQPVVPESRSQSSGGRRGKRGRRSKKG